MISKKLKKDRFTSYSFQSIMKLKIKKIENFKTIIPLQSFEKRELY